MRVFGGGHMFSPHSVTVNLPVYVFLQEVFPPKQ